MERKKKEKLLDDEIFGDCKIQHILYGEPLGDIQPKDVHPLLDHYNKERNEKLARKLFKEKK